VKVEAIYEPPQDSSDCMFNILEDPKLVINIVDLLSFLFVFDSGFSIIRLK